MKLGWELRTDSKALWCQVLRGKYYRHTADNNQLIMKMTDSSLWKAIASLDPFLSSNEFWVLGSGRTVNAWTKKWISSDTRIADMQVDIPLHMLDYNVSDLVDSNGHWHFDILSVWLQEGLLGRLKALPPPTATDGEDERSWPGTANGSLTVASAYRLLCNLKDPNNEKTWKQIWKLETKASVQQFLWVVCHGRLLTNDRKAKVHLGSSDCYHCVGVAETTLYILRDCPIVYAMWINLVVVNCRNRFFNSNLLVWFSDNLLQEMGTHTDLEWATIWANGCHLLWSRRNKITHDDTFPMPWHPLQIVLKETKNYKTAMQN